MKRTTDGANIYRSKTSHYQHEVRAMADIRGEMRAKLVILEKSRKELIEKLNKQFDYEMYRQLNILEYKIEVATERLCGEWIRGYHLHFHEIAAKH